MNGIDKFVICNILLMMIWNKLFVMIAFPIGMVGKVANITTIVNLCLIIFDVFYFILKFVLKTSKKVNEINLINNNNDD